MVDIRYFPLKQPCDLSSTFLIIILLVILLLSGCATSRTGAVVEDRTLPVEPKQQPQPQTRTYKIEEPEHIVPQPLSDITDEPDAGDMVAPQTVQQQSSPAVVALLDDADHYAVSGKKQEAVASIERALRIEPKNPLLWHKLGQLRLQEGQWEQAIAMASKSNVLAPGNRSLQAENWMIIARARDATGDKRGAAEALNTANRLRNY